jgi:alpha-L-rhamnosidase
MILRTILAFFILAYSANAQSPRAPFLLRTDLLLHSDRVWQNGLLTNLSLTQADSTAFKGQLALIRSQYPSFSWVLADTVANYRQTAYQIILSSTEKNKGAKMAEVWDSGKVKSGQNTCIMPAGKPLDPGRIYFWKVKVWDQRDVESPFSLSKAFRTADNLKAYEPPFSPLVKEYQQPVHEKTFGNKNIVYDFGKDAFSQLVVSILAGNERDTVWVHFGEGITADGRVDRKPAGTLRYRRIPLALQQGPGQYQVHFPADKRNTGPKAILMPDYIGEVLPFRYAELELPSEKVKIGQVSRLTVTYSFDDQATHFASSDTTLNRIWDLCKYSIKATTFSGYYVDGDRERIPYEADAYINQLSHYATDVEFNMAKRSLDYLVYHATWPTEWSLQNLLIAWYDYLYSGDIRTARALYPELKAKVLLALARPDGLISTRTGKQTPEFTKSIHFETFDGKATLQDIVDWPQKGVLGLGKKEAGETDGFVFTDYNAVVNAFHYQALIYLGEIASVIDEKQDAILYQKAAQKVKIAFQKTFIDPKTGLVRDGEGTDHSSLHANMMALAFGLVPEKLQQKVLDHMRSRGMACSVYGSQFLLDGLYNAKESDYALALMTSTQQRSWYNMIRTGSTITTEAWDTQYKPNQDWNHAWGAAPANIIVRKLMGVEPLTPAFGTVSIKPQPGTLAHAQLQLTTLKGVINVDFENTEKQFRLQVNLPANTEGVIYIPKKFAKSKLTSNGRPVKATQEGDFFRIAEVGSGNHQWEVVPAP